MDSSVGAAAGYIPDKTRAIRTGHLGNKDDESTEDTVDEASPPVEEVLNVSVVSNSLLLREGLLALLGAHMRLRIVGAYSGSPLPERPVHCPPGHVVLLDGSIGEEAAVAWTHYWLGLTPTPNVVVLELLNNFDAVLAAIEAGASGYALHGASLEEVVGVIRQAQHNQAEGSPEVTTALFARLASYSASARRVVEAVDHARDPLTSYEMQILELIAQDYSDQKVADRLAMPAHDIKYHVLSMLEKLNQYYQENTGHVAAQ